MISADNSLILIIDIQEKLVNMLASDSITVKAAKLLQAAELLGIPVIMTEQYPVGLGATVEVLKQHAGAEAKYFEKTAFSAMRESGFRELLAGYQKRNILICGVEGHVCVYQTASDLLADGYDVEVIVDITASRSDDELEIAMGKMKQLGARLTTLEIGLFELLKTAKHPKFKEIQALIK